MSNTVHLNTHRTTIETAPAVGDDWTVMHSGKQHAYQHALSMQRLGRLQRFITTTYYQPKRQPDRLLGRFRKANRWLARRRLNGLDDDKITRRFVLEIPELVLRSVGAPRQAEAAMYWRDAAFDRWVSRNHAGTAKKLWGFQGSCLDALRAARSAGHLTVCEFATAHVTAAARILGNEAERHPEWAGTISNFRFPDAYRRRLEAEPHAADRCIAASGFTKMSLVESGVSVEKIDILPLGADLDQFRFHSRHDTGGPLKVLFCGGIGQRKGVKYLLQAMKQIDSSKVRLSLLGPPPADPAPLKDYANEYQLLGRTDQTGVATEMLRHDLLVLPSVFEGFGLVIIEAMATGMPVIASTHSCGPEVIRQGVDGFVLQPDDVDGLSEKIDWCAAHRSSLVQMGRAAADRAGEFSWKRHTERLGEILKRWD